METTVKETNNTKRYIEAFWKGWLSTFDLSGGTFLEMPDLDRGPERDCEAIASDWQAVGNDLRWAMGQVIGGR
jgi:hypothetical protein